MAHRHALLAAVATVGALSGIGAGVLAYPQIISGPGSAIVRGSACQPGMLCMASDADATTTVDASSADDIPARLVTAEMLDGAFASKESWTVPTGARAILVPHHLVAARQIASLLSATPKPSVVYLVSPDHFSQGKSIFTTTDHGFVSAFGRVPGDDVAVASLLRQVPALRSDPTPFRTEHGVTGLIPFITRAWPDVPVVPIIVRIDSTDADRVSLASALEERLRQDPNALLLGTVDFSHYQPAEVADFHDVLAEDVVTSLADLEADRVELDSPGALGVTLKVARAFGLGDVTIHAHTNSLRLLQATEAEQSTSHLLVSFAPGPIRPQSVTTMLFTGDLMFDRTVATRTAASKDPAYAFEKIHGDEDRFFKGQDLVVGNLEGPVTAVKHATTKAIDFAFAPTIPSVLKSEGFDAVSQANNHSLDQGRAGAEESQKLLTSARLAVFGDEVHDDASSSLAILERRGQKIAILGFNTTDHPLDETAALAAIQQAKSRAGRVVVFMHWGQEYTAKPIASQVDRAHWFIDHGVDAVIGSHPHWMESVEVYHGHPIAYSLGNFIFDQDWSAETRFGLVAGLVLSESGSELHLYPIKIDQSQPVLLTGKERDARLERLAGISDPALKAQILAGVIHIQTVSQ